MKSPGAAKHDPVDTVMATIGWLREERGCRRDVRIALDRLARYQPTVMTPGKLRDLLNDSAQALSKALHGLTKLPAGYRPNETLLHEIDQLRSAKNDQASKIKVKRSGGSREKKEDALVKELAALLAFDLIVEHVGRVPTLTQFPKSEWIRVAEALFRWSVGGKGGLERACRDVYKALELAQQKAKRNKDPMPDWLKAELS